jgi:hypothetical protein
MPFVEKGGHEPAGLRAKRRMRESKECELSSAYADAFVQDFLESAVDEVIRYLRIISDLHAIFVTELNPNEVIVVLGVLSKNAVVAFWLRTIQVGAGRSNSHSVDDSYMLRSHWLVNIEASTLQSFFIVPQ